MRERERERKRERETKERKKKKEKVKEERMCMCQWPKPVILASQEAENQEDLGSKPDLEKWVARSSLKKKNQKMGLEASRCRT
jgi:hypothetical protein